MEVHKRLGSGFHEVIYQRALQIEMELAGIHFKREFEMRVYYRDLFIGTQRVDFLVEDLICVELKARSSLEDYHFAQTFGYLKAYKVEIGLLINFGEKSLKFKRLTYNLYDSND